MLKQFGNIIKLINSNKPTLSKRKPLINSVFVRREQGSSVNVNTDDYNKDDRIIDIDSKQQWEVDPEFDYVDAKPQQTFYDFITDQIAQKFHFHLYGYWKLFFGNICPIYCFIGLQSGNILLHLFTPSTRARYDLESLWMDDEEWNETMHWQLEQSSTTSGKHHTESPTFPPDWQSIVAKIKQSRQTGQ